MKKMMALMLASLMLAACGKKLDGTYSDKSGVMEISFHGNKMEMMGMEMEYTIEDGQVKVKRADGTVLLMRIKDDETLQFPLVGELKKR